MSIDWQSQIVDVDVTVEPVTPSSAVFAMAAHVATVTYGTSGDLYRIYTSVDGLQTDADAGDIDTAALDAGRTAFAQSPAPDRWMLIKYATSYSASLSAVWTAGARFLYYTIESRTGADATSAFAFAAGRRVLFVAQSSSTDWYAPGPFTIPAAWSTLAGSSQVVMVWHATDAQYADVGLAARASAVDPDVACFGFQGPVGGTITANASLTATQLSNLQSRNANTVLVNIYNLTTTPVLRFGITLSGEKAYAILTKYWAEIRIAEAIVGWFQGYDSLGYKVPGGLVGETQVRGIVSEFITDGTTGPSPHFGPTPTLPQVYAIDVDYAANTRSIAVTGRVGLFDSTDSVDITLNLVRT